MHLTSLIHSGSLNIINGAITLPTPLSLSVGRGGVGFGGGGAGDFRILRRALARKEEFSN